jgi:hypothetical protein
MYQSELAPMRKKAAGGHPVSELNELKNKIKK